MMDNFTLYHLLLLLLLLIVLAYGIALLIKSIKRYFVIKYNTSCPKLYATTIPSFKLYGKVIRRGDFICFTIQYRTLESKDIKTKTIEGQVVGQTFADKLVIHTSPTQVMGFAINKIKECNIHTINDIPFNSKKNI